MLAVFVIIVHASFASELEMISARDLGSFIVAQDDSHLLGGQAPVVTMSSMKTSDWSQWLCTGLSLVRAGVIIDY